MLEVIANYVQCEYKGGSDIAKAMRNLALPTFDLPDYPTPKPGKTMVNPGKIFLWQQEVQETKKQIVQLQENKKHAYALVIGQCSPNLLRPRFDDQAGTLPQISTRTWSCYYS